MNIALQRLYTEDVQAVTARADGTFADVSPPLKVVVLSGSFNPLHEGHRRLLEAAIHTSGRPGAFEISIENVDKPTLEVAELERRLGQFSGYSDVLITRARLFSEKAGALPGAWFAIGFDTMVRLLDDSYYRDETALHALEPLHAAGVRFLVAGRVDGAGVFRGVESLHVPRQLDGMLVGIPESDFRVDISSTALRKRRSL